MVAVTSWGSSATSASRLSWTWPVDLHAHGRHARPPISAGTSKPLASATPRTTSSAPNALASSAAEKAAARASRRLVVGDADFADRLRSPAIVGRHDGHRAGRAIMRRSPVLPGSTRPARPVWVEPTTISAASSASAILCRAWAGEVFAVILTVDRCSGNPSSRSRIACTRLERSVTERLSVGRVGGPVGQVRVRIRVREDEVRVQTSASRRAKATASWEGSPASTPIRMVLTVAPWLRLLAATLRRPPAVPSASIRRPGPWNPAPVHPCREIRGSVRVGASFGCQTGLESTSSSGCAVR